MNKDLYDQITTEVDNLKVDLKQLADYLFVNPELGHQEFKAADKITKLLAQEGFQVETGTAELDTAFKARFATSENNQGPTIGFLAEYDALPEGHSCGHNLIAAMSVGAAIALKRCGDKFQGNIEIYGTPAEETDGGKVIMTEKGVFDHLDAAFIAHPGDKNTILESSLAMDAIEFIFHGKSAHAAAAPHEGVNALDAVINFFNNINALRQQLTEDIKIHGIIAEGGTAPNIIPSKTVAKFYIRAKQREHLNKVIYRVMDCAKGAATATGCSFEHDYFELSFDNMVTNQVLANLFEQKIKDLGADFHDSGSNMGSTDMGNVSHIAPAIHPFIAISSHEITAHTEEFKVAAGSEQGKRGMVLGAKSLALTAADLFTKTELIQKVKSEFSKSG